MSISHKLFMKHIVLMFTFLALIISCSGAKEQSSVKFSSFTMSLSASDIKGGVLIYGESLINDDSFTIVLKPGELYKEFDVDSGEWKFHAVAYAGDGGPLTGPIYCDEFSTLLEPGEQELPLFLNSAKCLEMQRNNNTGTTVIPDNSGGVVFNPVTLFSCSGLYSQGFLPSIPCNGIYGNSKSFRIGIREYQAINRYDLYKPFTGNSLNSNCYTGSPGKATDVIIPGIYGDGEAALNVVIRAYDQIDCNGDFKEYIMPRGIFGGTLDSFYAYGEDMSVQSVVYLDDQFFAGYIPGLKESTPNINSGGQEFMIQSNKIVGNESCTEVKVDVMDSSMTTYVPAIKDYNFTIKRFDEFNNELGDGSLMQVYSDPACTSVISSVRILSGATEVTFYQQPVVSGKYSISLFEEQLARNFSHEFFVNSNQITLSQTSVERYASYGDASTTEGLTLTWQPGGGFTCSFSDLGSGAIVFNSVSSSCDDTPSSSCSFQVDMDPNFFLFSGGVEEYQPVLNCSGGGYVNEKVKLDFYLDVVGASPVELVIKKPFQLPLEDSLCYPVLIEARQDGIPFFVGGMSIDMAITSSFSELNIYSSLGACEAGGTSTTLSDNITTGLSSSLVFIRYNSPPADNEVTQLDINVGIVAQNTYGIPPTTTFDYIKKPVNSLSSVNDHMAFSDHANFEISDVEFNEKLKRIVYLGKKGSNGLVRVQKDDLTFYPDLLIAGVANCGGSTDFQFSQIAFGVLENHVYISGICDQSGPIRPFVMRLIDDGSSISIDTTYASATDNRFVYPVSDIIATNEVPIAVDSMGRVVGAFDYTGGGSQEGVVFRVKEDGSGLDGSNFNGVGYRSFANLINLGADDDITLSSIQVDSDDHIIVSGSVNTDRDGNIFPLILAVTADGSSDDARTDSTYSLYPANAKRLKKTPISSLGSTTFIYAVEFNDGGNDRVGLCEISWNGTSLSSPTCNPQNDTNSIDFKVKAIDFDYAGRVILSGEDIINNRGYAFRTDRLNYFNLSGGIATPPTEYSEVDVSGNSKFLKMIPWEDGSYFFFGSAAGANQDAAYWNIQ